MASPFAVFRKNQKVMMAILVGFSMLAFIVADSLNATSMPILLGAILGALALWLLSGKGGTEGWLIAAVGGVLGAVVGLYGPGLLGNNAAVMTSEGELTVEDINYISKDHQIANDFLSQVARFVHEKLPEEERAAYRGPAPFGFVNIVDEASQRENATLTFLFGKEADKLGITFTDEAIRKYIVEIAQNKMTNIEFQRIRNQLQVGNGELIATLRSQLRAREAFHLLVPRSGPTPQDLWADYRKLSVNAETLVASIPADAFLDEIDEPSDDEVADFFNRYKSVPAGFAGSPGFLVPRQVNVAYLELAMADVRKSIEPPTDAEVREFYEKNRAQFDFQQGAAPGTAPSMTPGAASGAMTPVEAPRPASTEAPAESNEQPTPEQPAAEDKSPTTPPVEAQPAPAEPVEEKPAESGEESSAILRKGTEYVAFQEESADQEESAPAGEAPADGKSKAETSGETAPAGEESAEKTPAETPTTPPTGKVTPPELPAPAAPAAPPSEPTPAILDSIREDLLNQKARQAADDRLEKILEDVQRMVAQTEESVPLPTDSQDPEQQKRYQVERRNAVKRLVSELQDYAGEHADVTYRATPYLSAQELYDSEDHPIGSAVRWEKNAPVFGRDTSPVVDQIFRTSAEQPLMAIPAQNLINESRYVALKVADVEPREPKLDDEGVREKVVRAWKLQKGKELAAERAKALAAKAKGENKLAGVLEGQTITGGKDSRPLTPSQVGPFTWLRRSTLPGQGFQMPDIAPNDLPQLPGAGEAFMKTVFESLKVGETGAVASTDGTTWYVVEVESRSSKDEVAKMRDEFLKENPFFFLSPFRMRMSQEASELRQQWFEEFKQAHDVVYPGLPVDAAS